MTQQWFAKIDGATVGPVAIDELRKLAADGRLNGDTPVRRGDDGWLPAAQAGVLDQKLPGATVDAGSRATIPVAPSLNDTTEWRMLAETAKTADVKDPGRDKPLARKAAAKSARVSAQAPSATTAVWVAVAGLAVAAAALLVWAFAG